MQDRGVWQSCRFQLRRPNGQLVTVVSDNIRHSKPPGRVDPKHSIRTHTHIKVIM